MSSHPLIDLDTEYELRRLSPKIGEYAPHDARNLLEALEGLSTPERLRTGLDDQPYYLAFLSEVLVGLPEGLTPKRLGRLCRALCLTLQRRGPGFVVAWNLGQVKVLRNYFKA